MIAAAAFIIVLLVIAAAAGYRHQCLLKDRARLMHDAIRHRDFSFHLPTKGLLFGERALQEALNDMGQEIQKLVARGEVESWQRLTRVLTHEIMNATTPIRSISQAYLARPDIKGTPYEEGIRAIRDTSTGLATFVDSYRKLTQLQNPVIENIPLKDFVEGIKPLYPQIEWHIHIPEDATWSADKNMLRQVFINLTKNAIEAHASAIDIRCFHKHPESIESSQFSGIYFSNNGDPIPADVAKEMFIPFFSTKPSGSGIGLSISRQMLMMQSINLSLAEHNVAGYHVTFRME